MASGCICLLVIIATDSQDIGLNNGVNATPVPPKQTQTVQGTKTKQSHPEQPDYHQKVVAYAKAHNLSQSWIDGCSAEPGGLTRWINACKAYLQSQSANTAQPINISEQHENNKTALIVGSIVIGVAALALYKII